MKRILEIAEKKPKLYEPGPQNIWDNCHISKSMLKAHLDENLESATRKLDSVIKSVDWIADILPPEKYPMLLDLGCGPGIYAELFCQKGYEVTGIDLSERSILYAQSSANNKRLKIQYTQGDYTKIRLNNIYSLITLIYCDFGVLSKEIRKELASKIYQSLFPDGVFLFDVFTPLRYKDVKEINDWEVCKDGFWHEDLCLSLHSLYRYDEDNTFLNQYVVATEEEITYYNIWEHTFTLEELRNMLEDVGFRNVEFWGDVTGKQYDDLSDTICVIARK